MKQCRERGCRKANVVRVSRAYEIRDLKDWRMEKEELQMRETRQEPAQSAHQIHTCISTKKTKKAVSTTTILIQDRYPSQVEKYIPKSVTSQSAMNWRPHSGTDFNVCINYYLMLPLSLCIFMNVVKSLITGQDVCTISSTVRPLFQSSTARQWHG